MENESRTFCKEYSPKMELSDSLKLYLRPSRVSPAPRSTTQGRRDGEGGQFSDPTSSKQTLVASSRSENCSCHADSESDSGGTKRQG